MRQRRPSTPPVGWRAPKGARRSPSTPLPSWAGLGCDSDPFTGIRIAGLGDRQTVSAVLDAPDVDGSGALAAGITTSFNNGVAFLFIPFDGTGRTTIGYVVTTEGAEIASDTVDIEDVCAGTGALTVSRDCASPESFTFTLNLAGLEPDTQHSVSYSSDGFSLEEGTSGNPVFDDFFTTDDEGGATVTSVGAGGDGVVISDGALVVDFGVVSDEGLGATRVLGQATVAACTATPPSTGGQPVDPPVTVTNPRAGAGTVPVAGVPTTKPALVEAAHGTTPRARATAGSLVGSLALLGGGLVLAGGLPTAGARFARR